MSDYPEETLDSNWEDNGTMPDNVDQLRQAVVGHRIISAEQGPCRRGWWGNDPNGLILTLDDGTRVTLANTNDCCAYTELESFLLDPAGVDHMIMGISTAEKYTTWHIYADYGDVLTLKLGWSCGNPFYYGYGFSINVVPAGESLTEDEGHCQ